MDKTDYRLIRLWCSFMGSFPYYTDDEVARARKSHAPTNAISQHEMTWTTLDDVTNVRTLDTLHSMAEARGWNDEAALIQHQIASLESS